MARVVLWLHAMPGYHRLLVVDDEPDARAALVEKLRSRDYDVEIANASEAVAKAESHAARAAIVDLKSPVSEGIAVVERLRAMRVPPAIVVIADAEGSGLPVLRAGAAQRVTRPLDFEELVLVVDNVLANEALRRETEYLRASVRDRVASKNIVGSSPQLQRAREIIDQVSPSQAAVLITGETGTGKELVANAIHERSPRANRPFIKMHCAGLAESLLESELFGGEKGSFAEARSREDGRLALADGGTLFLDEVGELPRHAQVRLLKFLHDGEIARVGGVAGIRVDVRVIAATDQDLQQQVARGQFRADLFYLLSVVRIEMPPLRHRKGDIPMLAEHFVARCARDNKTLQRIAPDAIEALVGYDWPGNIGELEHAIGHAVALATGSTIDARYLPRNIHPMMPIDAPAVPGSTMAELERYAILQTLRATGGSTSRAAEMLGISTRTVQYRLHEYHLVPRAVAPVSSSEIAPDAPRTERS